MKTKMIKSLSVCGLALSLVAAGQSVMIAHNLVHAELPPVAAVGDGTTATGKVLIKGDSSKNSFVEQVSQDGSKTTVQYFIGNKQLPGFDENAKILAQDGNTVVLSEPSSHALAVVAKDHNGQALTAYTGVDLDYLTNKIKQEAAKNKNIIYDRIDTRDCTVGGKHFSIPYLQTEITKIDGGVTVMGNGIGCHIFETNGRLQEIDNVGAYAHKYVPSKVSIAANNDVTVDYENSPYTYKNNILNPNNPSANTVAKSTANSNLTSSSSAKDNSPVSDKQADKSTSASVSKSDDKAVTASVNSGDQTDTDTKAEKGATSSTSNGDKSSTKTDSLDDASSKSVNSSSKSSSAESQSASSESSSVKSESKSESSSVSSSSEKLSEAENGSDESGAADKVAGQSSSIASSPESSQLFSASSSKNSAGNGTDSRTTASGQTGSNSFEASGTNPGDSGNESGAITSAQPGGDDTYSAQKAAMLAKTNAKAAQSGIVSAIGAAIGVVAGWFGLKKKG